MIISRETLASQHFIIGAVGGTLVSSSTHRPQDILVGMLRGLTELREATKRANRPNMRADIDSAIEKLAEEYPLAITSDGAVTARVAHQADALVGDPEEIKALAIDGAVDAVWSALDEIIGRGDCYVCGEDGIGIYAIDASDYDY